MTSVFFFFNVSSRRGSKILFLIRILDDKQNAKPSKEGHIKMNYKKFRYSELNLQGLKKHHRYMKSMVVILYNVTYKIKSST